MNEPFPIQCPIYDELKIPYILYMATDSLSPYGQSSIAMLVTTKNHAGMILYAVNTFTGINGSIIKAKSGIKVQILPWAQSKKDKKKFKEMFSFQNITDYEAFEIALFYQTESQLKI